MHDAGARGHHLEVVEGRLAPAQELVALAVALVFEVGVELERVAAAEHVDDDGVVDDHLGGRERVDGRRVAAELGDGLAHRREVNDARHAGEVLHDHARGRELNLGVGLGVGVPLGERAHVVGGDVGAVFGAQQRLGEDLQRVRELLEARHGVESIDLVARCHQRQESPSHPGNSRSSPLLFADEAPFYRPPSTRNRPRLRCRSPRRPAAAAQTGTFRTWWGFRTTVRLGCRTAPSSCASTASPEPRQRPSSRTRRCSSPAPRPQASIATPPATEPMSSDSPGRREAYAWGGLTSRLAHCVRPAPAAVAVQPRQRGRVDGSWRHGSHGQRPYAAARRCVQPPARRRPCAHLDACSRCASPPTSTLGATWVGTVAVERVTARYSLPAACRPRCAGAGDDARRRSCSWGCGWPLPTGAPCLPHAGRVQANAAALPARPSRPPPATDSTCQPCGTAPASRAACLAFTRRVAIACAAPAHQRRARVELRMVQRWLLARDGRRLAIAAARARRAASAPTELGTSIALRRARGRWSPRACSPPRHASRPTVPPCRRTRCSFALADALTLGMAGLAVAVFVLVVAQVLAGPRGGPLAGRLYASCLHGDRLRRRDYGYQRPRRDRHLVALRPQAGGARRRHRADHRDHRHRRVLGGRRHGAPAPQCGLGTRERRVVQRACATPLRTRAAAIVAGACVFAVGRQCRRRDVPDRHDASRPCRARRRRTRGWASWGWFVIAAVAASVLSRLGSVRGRRASSPLSSAPWWSRFARCLLRRAIAA